MVAITYDTPELQQKFIDAASITYSFISDIDTATVSALGILNDDYSPGDPAYGIPRPGIYIVNPDNRIVGKIFVEDFRKRVDGEAVLARALELLE